MTNLESILKSRNITLPAKVCIVKAMVFPVVIHGCEYWTIKKPEHQRIWCFQTVVLEKTFENPLDSKENKPVNPKGNQPWMFIGTTDSEAEAPILWPSDAKSWLTGKDSDVGKGQRQEKGTTTDEMVRWHYGLNRHEFKHTPGDGEGQVSLACCMQSMGSQSVRHDLATEQQQHRNLAYQ